MKSLILGLCLCFGLAFTANADDLSRLKNKADKGDAQAQYDLGRYYLGKRLSGYSKLPYVYEPETEIAKSYLILAANQNHRDAMIELGTLGLLNKDPNEAIKWYELANYTLGLCLVQTNPDLVPEDMTKIVTTCLPALEDPQYTARKDLFVAEYQMGRAFAEGLGGVEKDISKAISFMMRASDHGYILANEWLGAAYFDGTRVPQDYKMALTYFEKLSSSDSSIYLDYTARMFETGINYAQDIEEARRFYFHAAERNNPHAQQWIKAHFEVTKESLDHRELILKTIGEQFPFTQTLPNGTTSQVPAYDVILRNIANFYPERAMENEIQGSSTVECQFNELATAEHCIILQEYPKGYGFGSATLKIMSRPFKMDDREGFVAATKGKWFRMEFRWRLY